MTLPAGEQLLDASSARMHLLALSAQGVGYKSVAAACDVSTTTLCSVLSGKVQGLRAATLARILEVTPDAVADGGKVPAAETWKLIGELLEEGFTKREIARRLGSTSKRPMLLIGRERCWARTAQRVAKLHKKLMT